MSTRNILKDNLNKLIDQSGKNKKQLSADMGIPYTTLVDWANGKNFPRADGIELLVKYFNISESDLLGKDAEEGIDTVSAVDTAKVALFGGDSKVTEAMWEEVKRYAQYIKEREENKN